MAVVRRKASTFTAGRAPVFEQLMEDVMTSFAMRPVVGLRWAVGLIAALVTMALLAPQVQAQSGDAEAILKAMSEYVGSQKDVSLAYDSDIEVITAELQKVQFTSSGRMQLSRPDKVHATRTGGYSDVEFFFDGRTFTVYGKNLNAFAQADSPGSIDDVVGKLRNDYSVEAPGADLLLSSVYDKLIEDVIDAKHIGLGVIDGVECEHLAFRNPDVDWQVWVETGARPIPRKYIITSKAVTGAPQYTLRIKDWRTDAATAADAFTFKLPAGAKKVDFKELADEDEVPAGFAR
jgi:hypothetical protein